MTTKKERTKVWTKSWSG